MLSMTKNVEYSVERKFTWGSFLQSFHFSELKFALNKSLVASDSPTRLYSPRVIIPASQITLIYPSCQYTVCNTSFIIPVRKTQDNNESIEF